MQSLFLKIFLWFWLATGVVGLALLTATEITRSEPVAKQWRYMTGNAVGVYAETAVEVLERDGGPALVVYLERVERASHIRAVMYDERGEEVTGRSEPAGARELAERARGSDQPEFRFLTGTTLIARRVLTRDRVPYVLAGEVPLGQLAPLQAADPAALALRLLAVLLAGGAVCYALARYISAPVGKLRAGVRRLAEGDLTVRVSPRMAGRRDELADLGHDFDLMAGRIESLVLSQRRLLGDISHELRSPLARMAVALEFARQRSGPQASGALDRIEREAERLNELIGQLLTLTQLEMDSKEPEKTEFDLSELVGEVAADADFEARGLDRTVRVIESEECSVVGDAALLRSAVENVVRNAVRYTAKNTEVEITLHCRRNDANAAAIISVRDHGEGVPADALKDLFRPFYRVADARDRQTGGTGLGLSITQRAVLLHGGSVEAANAPGGGLRVEIRLPAAVRERSG